MATKTLNTRIQHKTDTTTNWSKAENFSPLKGELIIYQDSNSVQAKVGDGTTNVNSLPFLFNIPALLAKIEELEKKLSNFIYDEETNTYTFDANIITLGTLTEENSLERLTSCTVDLDNSYGMHYLEIIYTQLNEDGTTESVTIEDSGTDGVTLTNVLCGSTIDIYNWTGSFEDGSTEMHLEVGTDSEQTFIIM